FGMDEIRRQEGGDTPRTPAAPAARDGQVLNPIDLVGDREAHRGGPEATLPEDLAGRRVQRADPAVEVSRENDSSGGRQGSGKERCTLFDAPDFAHRSQ